MQDLSEALLESFRMYYNIDDALNSEDYFATAFFSSEEKRFFLSEALALGESKVFEKVYFSSVSYVDKVYLETLSKKTFDICLENIDLEPDHYRTDVALFILCDKVYQDIKKDISKIRFHKSYKGGLQGYSNFNVCVIETDSNRAYFNNSVNPHKKLVKNLLRKRNNK